MEPFLEFEKPIASLEKKLQDLREISNQEGVDFHDEIEALEKKLSKLIDETYSRLGPWQKVQLSRHPSRPYTRDCVDALFENFMELQGDRLFADDQAILGGVGLWRDAQGEAIPVMIIGHQKGRTTKQKMERNFGMARPEGYRKAMRLMTLAERAQMPIVTFIDTPGAYPGLDAEERGQSQAIAESITLMFGLKVPVVTIVLGEGGSGGALAIGVADRVLMMEYSTYSVISPESCASILWSDSSQAERASGKLKMSPPELLKQGIIDDIIREPRGGAHSNWKESFELIRGALKKHLDPLLGEKAEKLIESRFNKFRQMGTFALAHAPMSGSPDNSQGSPQASSSSAKSNGQKDNPKTSKGGKKEAQTKKDRPSYSVLNAQPRRPLAERLKDSARTQKPGEIL